MLAGLDIEEIVSRLSPRDLDLALEAAESRRDLLRFAEIFWHVNDPEEPFVNGWPIQAIADHLMAVTDGHIKRLIVNVPPGFSKSLLTDVFWPAWEWGPCGMATMRYLAAAYTSALTQRDNGRFLRVLLDPKFLALWGTKFALTKIGAKKVENDRTGWKLATSVEGYGTGERGNRIIVDDPNNPKDVESDIVREGTNLWLREVMPDRLNNLKEGAIVIIQQRTHEHDASGTLIDVMGRDYVLLMIPMEYDPTRHCHVSVTGWHDPRGLDADGNLLDGFLTDPEDGEMIGQVAHGSAAEMRAGKLAWADRFPRDVCENMAKVKGPFAWCNPYEAPILMADLSLRPIGEVRAWDRIIGFTTDTHNGKNRRHLFEAQVTAVHRSWRKVVRITFASGATIRCTADHRWYTGRHDKTHPLYAQAALGKRLLRVCPSALPRLSQAQTLAGGWVSGFFDGAGSMTLARRRPNDPPVGLISFNPSSAAETAKLVLSLEALGFSVGSTTKGARRGERWHYLLGNDLPMYQRFLHLVQPTKWRERMMQAPLGANFVIGREKVVKIEPDGEEAVYGLTTTTGNYVVWGLASSNSGQYQQIPTPRGGGLIQRDWWRLWPGKDFPDFGTTIVSLDTAIKDKEIGKQDPDWNAITVWSAFGEDDQHPQLMLRFAQRMRGSLGEIVKMVADACQKYRADTLIIEDRTRGYDVAQEIRTQYGTRAWSTVLLDPTQWGLSASNKVARAIACQSLFSGELRTRDERTGICTWTGGVIWAPDTEWAEEVIQECNAFPRGAHDDYVDTITQALLYLRRSGVVLRKTEWDEMEAQRRKLENMREPPPLYPV